MLTVHHLGISQSERIIWLCEELEIPYELVLHQRDPITRLAPESYKSLHPVGTAPVIEDDAVTLAESGAIIEYIIARHGGGRLALQPEDAHYADYLFWLHGSTGTLMMSEMLRMVSAMLPPEAQANPVVQSLLGRGDKAIAMAEAQLGKTSYLAGDEFTAADIITFFPLTTMRQFMPRDFSALPNLQSYMQRVGSRPAYLRAMAKGDPELPLLLA